MTNFDDYNLPHRSDKAIFSPEVFDKCQADFDAYINTFNSVNDMICRISEDEASLTDSVYENIFDIAVNKYGSDDFELLPDGAVFVDGAMVAMAAADTLAKAIGVDLNAYRKRFSHLVEIGVSDEVQAANYQHYSLLFNAFESTYKAIREIVEESIAQGGQSFRDGYETIFNVGVQSIMEVDAKKELEPIETTLADESLFDAALEALRQNKIINANRGVEHPELIPVMYSELFDPLADVDSARIRDYMIGRLFSAKSAAREIKYLHQFHTRVRSELVERLINIGKYVEPYDDELKTVDHDLMRMNAFNSGMTIALSVVDLISVEVRDSRSKWGTEWCQLSQRFDSPEVLLRKTPQSSTECARVGESIIEIGNKLWNILPIEFQEMIEAVEDQLISTSTHINVFRSAFAYVFFFGREVLAKIVLDEREDDYIAGMMPQDEHFEAERIYFLGS